MATIFNHKENAIYIHDLDIIRYIKDNIQLGENYNDLVEFAISLGQMKMIDGDLFFRFQNVYPITDGILKEKADNILKLWRTENLIKKLSGL